MVAAPAKKVCVRMSEHLKPGAKLYRGCELFKKPLKVNPSYLNHFEVNLEKGGVFRNRQVLSFPKLPLLSLSNAF